LKEKFIPAGRPMTIRLTALIFVLLASALGCVPAAFEYWAPSADGGRLFSRVHQSGGIAPSDEIEFTFDEVKIRFHGYNTGLSITLLIPRGRSASFVSTEAKLYDGNSLSTAMEITRIKAGWDPKTKEDIYLRPTTTMAGESFSRVIGEPSPKPFHAFIELSGVERTQYRVKPPPIKVGTNEFEFPFIEFVKKKGFGAVPLNGP
jgi:hypothetical protein